MLKEIMANPNFAMAFDLSLTVWLYSFKNTITHVACNAAHANC
jgi:hypothetical protein